MTAPEQKQKLRREIEQRLSAMTQEHRRSEDAALCERLLHVLPPDPCDLCAFVPLSDEADITAFLRAVLERGYGLYLPRYDAGTITFHAVTSLEQELIEGAYSIPEPHPHLPVHDPHATEIILVPGRAFDVRGNRLGRGKGGYDKWIATQRHLHPSTRCIGVAYDEQILPELPTEAHDQHMDAIVSPTRTIATRGE